MAITYIGAGAVVYTTGNPSPLAPTHAIGDLLIAIVGTKPDTTPATLPAGWTLLGVVSGGTGTTGIDLGPMRIGIFTKIATSTTDSTGAITVTGNNVSAAQVFAYRPAATKAIDIAGTGAADTVNGAAFTATMPLNPGLTVGDELLVVGVTPTDAATYSAETVAATGMTTVALTEINEWVTATGNDMGGFIARGPIVTGTATAAPVLSATAAGTTTNVAGPMYLIRMREVPALVTRTAFDSGTLSATESATQSVYVPTDPNSYRQVVVSQGIKSLFRFDEPFGSTTISSDPSGSDAGLSTGTIGSPRGPEDRLGDPGLAYGTGTSAHFSFGYMTGQTETGIATNLDVPTYDISISAIIKVDGSLIDTRAIASSWGATSGSGFHFDVSSGSLSLMYTEGKGFPLYTVSGGTIVPGGTYHVALVGENSSGGSVKLYLNGVLVATGANSWPTNLFTVPLRIGGMPSAINSLGGTIDELAVWTNPLSASEINAQYQAFLYNQVSSTPKVATDEGILSATETSVMVPTNTGPTVVTASDTGSISAVDTSVSFVTAARTDTGTFSAADSSALFKTIAASDSGTLSANDASAAFKTISAVDSGTLSATEATSSQIAASLSTNDSGTLNATEISSLVIGGLLGYSATDSGTISAVDAAALSASSSTSDSGTLSAIETYSLSIGGTIPVITSEAGTLSASEKAHVAVGPYLNRATETFNIMPNDVLGTSTGISIGTNLGQADNALLTSGTGKMWWGNSSRWQTLPGENYTIETDIYFTGGGRSIYNVMFGMNSAGTIASMNGLAYRLDTGDSNIAFLRIDNGSHNIAINNPPNFIAPTGTWIRSIVEVVGTIATARTIRLSDGLLLNTSSIDFAPNINAFHSMDGYIGQWKDGAGGDIYVDNTFLDVMPVPAVQSVSASDTGTLSDSENASISVSSSTSDTGTFSITEARSIASVASTSDTGALSANDTSNLLVSASRFDSGTLSATDISSSAVLSSSSDTGTLSATDSSTLFKTIVASDFGTFSVTELATQNITATASDSGTLSANEAVSIYGTVVASDTGSLFVSENAMVFNDRLGIDSGTLSASEVSSLFITGTISFTASDAGTFYATDTSSSSIVSPTSDTGTLSGSDTSLLNSTSARTDAGTLSVTEVAMIFVTSSTFDSGTLSSSDSSVSSSNLIRTDNGTLSVTDNSSSILSSSTSDAGTLSVTETSSIFNSPVASDSGTLSAVEASSLFIEYTIPIDHPTDDTGLLSTSDMASLLIFAVRAESGTVSALDTSSSAVTSTRTDAGAFSATDSSVLLSTSVTTDIGTLSITESATLTIFNTSGTSDTGSISAGDTSALVASSGISDSGTLSAADASSVLVSLSRVDTGILSASDTSSTYIAGVYSDTGMLSATEESALAINSNRAASDTGTLSATEVYALSIGGMLPYLASDSGTFSATESAVVAAFISTNDTGVLSISESTTSAGTLSRSDTGTLSVADSATTFKAISVSDSGTFSITESMTIATSSIRSDAGTFSVTETSLNGKTFSSSDQGTFSSVESAIVGVRVAAFDSGIINAVVEYSGTSMVTTQNLVIRVPVNNQFTYATPKMWSESDQMWKMVVIKIYRNGAWVI